MQSHDALFSVIHGRHGHQGAEMCSGVAARNPHKLEDAGDPSKQQSCEWAAACASNLAPLSPLAQPIVRLKQTVAGAITCLLWLCEPVVGGMQAAANLDTSQRLALAKETALLMTHVAKLEEEQKQLVATWQQVIYMK